MYDVPHTSYRRNTTPLVYSKTNFQTVPCHGEMSYLCSFFRMSAELVGSRRRGYHTNPLRFGGVLLSSYFDTLSDLPSRRISWIIPTMPETSADQQHMHIAARIIRRRTLRTHILLVGSGFSSAYGL